MNGRDFFNKIKEKTCFSFLVHTGARKEKWKDSRRVTHGFHLVKGKSNHAMEDYLVSELKVVGNIELGLFAIFDGHMGHDVASYLQSHLFDNILKQRDFWTDAEKALKNAYAETDKEILEKPLQFGRGGSTAVTAILINRKKLVVANVGDSRAVLCQNGIAIQLSIDHEPSKEKKLIESKGGFVTKRPGDVSRVNGLLAVARAFGNKSLKRHLSVEPDTMIQTIENDVEFIILASDGLWKVMSNEEAVDAIKGIKDARSAAKYLIDEAVSRKSSDDISCVVVKFH